MEPQLEIDRIRSFERSFSGADTTEYYGMGELLKKYLGIPRRFPLLIHMDHGVPVEDEPRPGDLAARLPFFAIRRSRKEAYERKAGRKAYATGSPFVHYRRAAGIRRDDGAAGTVAFPVHSSHLVDVEVDWTAYAKSLAELPHRFHPIVVALYWKDLLAGAGEVFEQHGMRIVTSGHMADPMFARNFYDILRRHAYSTSNLLGSYSFYSVELGVPFFLYGAPPVFHNRGNDRNRPHGRYRLGAENWHGYEFQKSFVYDLYGSITIDRQLREACLEKLGVENRDDSALLRRVIFESALKSGSHTLVRKGIKEIRRARVALFSGR